MSDTFQQLARQKIVQRVELASIVQERQSRGEHGVFTNGCFDLLHLGHVRYLQEARGLGDFLILALNSDESTRSLKGQGRPLVPQEERAEILAALICIDYVIIFGEPTAAPLLTVLRPAIYVKGGDYTITEGKQTGGAKVLPEAPVVQAYGGIVQLIQYLPHHSTTELIEAIQRLPQKR